jgi:hypothetical protein
MTAQFSSSGGIDAALRNMQSAWKRIAHERVQARLDGMFTSMIFRFVVSRDTRGDLYEKYREQARRSQNSTSKVVSRELEDALRALENDIVEEGFYIFEDESPEKPIKSSDLLWAIYNFGLVPFIEGKILRDVCLKLANAQPSLGFDVYRPDAERFFSYNSAGLRQQFPAVIRIVDAVKDQCYNQTLQRSEKIHAQSRATSVSAPDDIQFDSIGDTTGPQPRTDQVPSAELRTQPSLPRRPETAAQILSGNENAKAPSDDKPERDLTPSPKQATSATPKKENASGEGARSSSTLVATGSLNWEDIEIRFLSDDRVQIYRRGKAGESLNFAEFGFEDKRTKISTSAWITLRELAQANGMIRDETQTRVSWTKLEKRVQEIRRLLRKYFEIAPDPIPYGRGTGYRTKFKVTCGPSFYR